MRRAWAMIGALTLAVTIAPVAQTGASFTAQATSAANSAASVTLPPPVVTAERSGMGIAQLTWEPTIRPDVAAAFTVERTIDGQTTSLDVGDGMTGDDMVRPPLAVATQPVSRIAAGTATSCAIAGGEVYCWGGTLFATGPDAEEVWSPVRMGGELAGKTVTEVSVAGFHACAVADGEAYCWGVNHVGQLGDGTTSPHLTPAVVGGVLAGKTVTDISVGRDSSCAIADARAYCWGSGYRGALGDGGSAWSSTPVAVGGVLANADVTAISTRGSSCALAGGAAYCWGDNTSGQLGDGSLTNRMTPVAIDADGVLDGLTVTAVAVSDRHSCALADGRVFCWGENVDGKLGDGSVASSRVPVAVDTSGVLAGREVTALRLGYRYSCALADGRAFCWGENSFGERGDGGATADRLSPVAVTAVSGAVTDLATGQVHACAIVSDAAHCWGRGVDGRLGDGTETSSLTARLVDASDALAFAECDPGWRPLRDPFRCGAPLGGGVPGIVDDLRVPRTLKAVTQLSAGDSHSCAVAGGTAVCWGQNNVGQLGDGTNEVRLTPIRVGGMLATRTVTAVSVSPSHSCAIADGEALCWGEGSSGQLGNGRSVPRNTPDRVTGAPFSGTTVTDISAGYSHSCAVGDGVVYCWGSRESGQTGDGGTTGEWYRAIAVGGALSGLTVTRVVVTRGLGCAIAHAPATPHATGVYCWGSGAQGRLGNGGTTSSAVPVPVVMDGALAGKTVTDIAAGSGDEGNEATVCVVADGDPYCWGAGAQGQLGDGLSTNSSVPVPVQTVVAIAPGTTTSISLGQRTACAIAAGAPVCWGWRADSAVPAAIDTSGALSGTVTSDIDFGNRHGCVVADARAYCWSVGGSFELGIGGAAYNSPPVAVDTSDVLSGCADGWASALGAGQCAPGPGVAVSYRVTYLKAGWSSPDAVATAAWREPVTG